MNNNSHNSAIDADIISAFDKVKKYPIPQNRRDFFKRLKHATFIAPVNANLPTNTPILSDGSITLPENTSLHFITMQSQQGDVFYPVFTNRDKFAICQYNPEPPTLHVNLDYYQPLLTHFCHYSGIVINPLSDTICIDREMLKDILLENITPLTLQKETKVRVCDSVHYPQPLMDKTIQILEKIPTINKAYLALMTQNDQTSFLIILDIVKESDNELIFDVISRNIKEYIPEGQPVDFIATNNSFVCDIIVGKTPFYSQKKKTLLNRLFGK